MGITRRRRLRAGTPVWSAYPLRVPRAQPLPRHLRTDVLVIGAGISGSLVAWRLASRGYRVAIVDRRGAIEGSTAASTALLQFELDVPLIRLARRVGRRNAERVWLRSSAAVMSLAEAVRSERIRAAVSRRASLYLAGRALDAGAMRREAAARQRIGIDSQLVGRRGLAKRFGIARSAAILSAGNLEADPRALTAGFLRSALRKGASLYAPFDIVETQCGRRQVQSLTACGAVVDSAWTVFCTGYELARIVKPRSHRIVSTWAIATAPQPRRLWPEQCLIWEASSPYLYVRATADGRVICGGEDSTRPVTDATLVDRKSAILQRKLHRLLPRIDTRPEFQWTGLFGQSDSGLPNIGAIPGHPHCLAVAGFGGNGITFSMLAADLIAARIAGKRDRDADLFAFE